MSFKDAIEKCDEKSVDELNEVYSSFWQGGDFVSLLIGYFSVESFQTKATWLLKKHLETGNKINEEETSKIWQKLPNLQTWEAKLHILQCIPFLELTLNEKDSIEAFLRENLGSKNKFVKAWAYNGFYELSKDFPEYQEEVKVLIENAMVTESASVKARLRNVMKSGFMKDYFDQS